MSSFDIHIQIRFCSLLQMRMLMAVQKMNEMWFWRLSEFMNVLCAAAASADEKLNRNIYGRCLLSASLQLLVVFDSWLLLITYRTHTHTHTDTLATQHSPAPRAPNNILLTTISMLWIFYRWLVAIIALNYFPEVNSQKYCVMWIEKQQRKKPSTNGTKGNE